ncbi:hypothetical protein SELMODRAFT_420841 [Selaginella moellendorffii]|uniref:F-box/LRR-repeat protein 15-like leucin rich repeat domain-containing protein n=1 Tax=Selaginella moellendorffii TaxID=88036 RepID=D8SDA5_SELML|nr:F-box/LRR-repeat protein 20 [Selaginella moellendorffii]EFJ17589.1 hypothetical protein SELMODRAFT_420841 [Selaginella moellendorffii]|eukprot:XP_002981401.1 F-box/LRR-repeat protein 20 [Selaginella moellendorffii]
MAFDRDYELEPTQPDAAAKVSCKTGDNACINSILTDDSLRAILSKLDTQGERDNYSLVCKRWLMVQSTERRRLAARAGPLMLQKIAARFTNLIELDFAQSTSRSFFPGVIDADLETIAKNFDNLERINLQECKGITDVGVGVLGKGIPGLRCVVLSGCRKVTDRAIEVLANSCSRLISLRVGRCKLVSDRAMEALSRNCKELEVLDVSGCIGVTDRGLRALARGCCKLQLLDLGKCVKVGDSGVASLAGSCPALKGINLLDCSKLTDESIASLARQCWSLESLLLGGCRNLTDASIQVVAKERGQVLKHLQLDWCSEVTDESLVAIFSGCDVLERLDAQSCAKITDLSLDALRNPGFLRELRLNHCPNISNAGIVKIAECCPRLELLELEQCFQVTREGIEAGGFPSACKIVLTKK